MNPLQIPAAYVKQIELMALKAKEWRANHPDADARVQFNYPETVLVASVVQDAIDAHFISVNGEGMELLKFIGALDGEPLATAFMLRLVMTDEPPNDPNTEAMAPRRLPR